MLYTVTFYCQNVTYVHNYTQTLLYRGISCISHEFSGTTPPSDCLLPTYWKVIFNLSTPAKKPKISQILDFISVNVQ